MDDHNVRNLGQDGIKRSCTEITFHTDTVDGHVNSCGDQCVRACGCALADCIKQRIEHCNDVRTEVDLTKVFASHCVTLEGQDGLMATPRFFK